jgi:Zn-finger protein
MTADMQVEWCEVCEDVPIAEQVTDELGRKLWVCGGCAVMVRNAAASRVTFPETGNVPRLKS